MDRLVNKKAEIVILDRGEGTSCTVNLHGMTVLSWRLDYMEQLFVSKHAVFDNMWPIRGGIQIIFPQYAYENIHMANHGFARINRWSVNKYPEVLQNGDVVAEFCLNDNPVLAANYWQFKFELKCKIVLLEQGLKFNLTVENLSDVSFNYNFGFLTFLKINDINKCDIVGLKGCCYYDKVELVTEKEDRQRVFINKWTDRIYEKTSNKIQISNVSNGAIITIAKKNMPDLMVWNPWSTKAKDLKHFGLDEYNKMLCLAPGYLCSELTINTTATQEFRMHLEIIN